MFAPNSNTIIDNNLVISTPNQQFSHFVTPNQQNPNYSFFNSPSHFLDHDDFFLDNNNVLPYQSPPPPPPTTTQGIENPSEQPRVPEKEKEIKEKAKGKRKRAVVRRTGKKDRHSKIHTAHGPRDRRMRLSLQIARKFFDLQDMLGFDKASKTIEWLFNKSKAAIKDLADRSCTTILIPSSPSNDGINGANNNSNSNNKQRKSKSGLFQKKENREKARARARERTKEKLIMMQKQGSDSIVANTSTNEQNPSENNNNIIEVNEYGFCQNNNGQQPLEEQMASVGIIEKFLTPSSSSSIFDFDHNDVHQDQVLSRSCDSIMIRSSNAIGFDDFAASWVTGNERISGAEFESNSSANCAFMGRPFNCKEGMKY